MDFPLKKTQNQLSFKILGTFKMNGDINISETFADIILPLPLPGLYTYVVPKTFVNEVEIGKRVIVSFGKNKLYAGIIRKIHDRKPVSFVPKPIEEVLDKEPIIPIISLEFWDWAAAYYCCSLGEICMQAFPASLRMSSESVLLLQEDEELHPEESELSNDEYLIFEAIKIRGRITLSESQKVLQKKNVWPLLRNLIRKNVIIHAEEIQPAYKPKLESTIALHPSYSERESVKALYDNLQKNPKQQDILLKLHTLSRKEQSVKKAELVKECGTNSASIIKRMVDKEILVEKKEIVSRLKPTEGDGNYKEVLSEEQSQGYQKWLQLRIDKPVTLLQGVTGSGKSHLYFKAIQEAVQEGKQVLYLLPEIALTVQMIRRLQEKFGKHVGVYHSRYSQMQRAEIWQTVLSNDCKIIIGARSAIYLPFTKLGLVIVDEEHDSSYKQQEASPYIQARDAAIKLAHLHSAFTLLGSATPSIETRFKAIHDRFGLIELKNRYGGAPMPSIQLINIKELREKRKMLGILSPQLLDALKKNCDAGMQSILLQNRRGYGQCLCCKMCGYIPGCHQCDVSLSYHKFGDVLSCHYCGSKSKLVTRCPACGAVAMEVRGFGTERAEENVEEYLPGKKIDRLDYDASRGKNAYENILNRFENRNTQILVGTQMLAKGLDFEGVSLVGILNADQLMFYPEFRATERAFQLMTQVAGRAGRREKQGQVYIQTSSPQHPMFNELINHDYNGFYINEVGHRAQFTYPPFVKLIEITFRNRDMTICETASEHFSSKILAGKGLIKMGPTKPGISFVRGFHIRVLLLKINPDEINSARLKEHLLFLKHQLEEDKIYRSVKLQIDVDP